MKCGNCHDDHSTAQEVRDCYGIGQAPGRTTQQVLLDERPKPKPASSGRLLTDIPAGYYAVPSRTGTNDLDFWQVDKPEHGKWKGYTFVKRIIGGREAQRVRKFEQVGALRTISQFGWRDAGRLYGQTIGRCYVCGRTLTDELSRQLGIGPVCREGR